MTSPKRWGTFVAVGALIGMSALATEPTSDPVSADTGDGTVTVGVIIEFDANSNYDPTTDLPLPDVPVTLTDDAGTQLSAVTDGFGLVHFDPATATPTLVGGRYRVEATIDGPNFHNHEAQVAGGDLSPLTTFVDVRGGVDAAITMGLFDPDGYVGTGAPPLEIGNRVWLDADRDGVQDPSEDPVEGVMVELVASDGTVVGSSVTDTGGNYYFGGSGNVNMVDPGEALAPSTEYVLRVPNAIGGSQQQPLTGWVLTQTDAGTSDSIDSDAAMVGVDAQIAVTTGGPGFNDHTYDFGFSPPGYDLALRKTLAGGSGGVVTSGDLVTYTITVFNQGTDDVTNATVIDFIPSGMALEDPDWTSGAGNTASAVLPGTIEPGASATVDISLRVVPGPFNGTLDNHAEVASFTDEWGGPREDVDSTPDEVFGNDNRVDDEIDNGAGDEDDEDIASVSVATPPPTTSSPQPPPAPTTALPNPGELPATGGSSGLLTALAVLSMIGGVGLALLARRRRPPSHSSTNTSHRPGQPAVRR